MIPAYVSALCRELEWAGRSLDVPSVHTVYLGGGTPSVLAIDLVLEILNTVRNSLRLSRRVEITLEANPNDVTPMYCEQLLAMGVNRLSIGAQSAEPDLLEQFHRKHAWAEVEAAVKAARHAGFENISLDLIYGAPGQSPQQWDATLDRALDLRPVHLSLYCLSVEPKTVMYREMRRGALQMPDEDLVAGMYDLARSRLGAAGFTHYEISNWARAGFECQHNLQYWRRRSYIGVGAGAFGFVDPFRYGVVDSPREYIRLMERADAVQEDGWLFTPAEDLAKREALSERDAWAEFMMLGLRLLQQGVSFQEFRNRFDRDLSAVYGDAIARLVDRKALEVDGVRIRLPGEKALVSNSILVYFV